MVKIGVLTSGGDAPGMNAIIRAIARTAITHGIEVVGIRRGFTGLINGEMATLSRDDVSNIIGFGGSILESTRSVEFETAQGRKKAISNLLRNQINGLMLIGGDGTFHGGSILAEESEVSIVGVPSTIDNDVYGTDFTIGFNTAVNFAVEAIDRIRDTARTFERVFFIEVMGHHTGFIALQSAVAGGAEGLVIPEARLDVDSICEKLKEGFRRGKKSAIIVVSEAQKPGYSYQISEEVSQKTGFECRVCVLGHLQRGGSPTAVDRILGSDLGTAAVEALVNGVRGQMVGLVGGKLVYTPLRETWEKRKDLNPRLEQLVNLLS
jgi:6-phosphofructokinase 1